MSPAPVPAGAGAASKDVKKESATARLLGSGSCATTMGTRDQLLICAVYRLCWYRRADGLPSRTEQLPLLVANTPVPNIPNRLTPRPSD